MTLTGNGFSYVFPENVIAMGDTATVATAYAIDGDGTETLTFTVPAEAVEGETDVVLIVDGRASNPLPFTVSP